MIRSETYLNRDAAGDGIDGRIHAEVIEMWRDYLRDNLSRKFSDEEYCAFEQEIDENPGLPLANGSLEQQAG
ncbi:hypothetical protein SDC9_183574 [bioreactor metagenome]|uniref:Uncharacterized protein n=1 Tax=bioreactor metagenome TaxID=1076179 RepID=A0A645HD65_9ZZZZ